MWLYKLELPAGCKIHPVFISLLSNLIVVRPLVFLLLYHQKPENRKHREQTIAATSSYLCCSYHLTPWQRMPADSCLMDYQSTRRFHLGVGVFFDEFWKLYPNLHLEDIKVIFQRVVIDTPLPKHPNPALSSGSVISNIEEVR